MNPEIELRMWSGIKYFYDPGNVYECLAQQKMGIFDHEKNGAVFEENIGIKGEKKFFAGDIIQHNKTRFIIKWSENLFCYVCHDPDYKTNSGLPNWRDLEWLNRVKNHVKKIGNIHEVKS